MNMISITSYYQGVRGRIVQEIEVLEASDLEGTEGDDWVKYYMGKYALAPIQLKSAAPILEEQVNRFKRTDFFDIERTVENSKALIGLPVEPNVNMGDLLKMKGDSWIHVGYEWEYRDGCIFIESSPAPDAVKQAIENTRKNFDSINAAIKIGNSQLPELIRQQVQKRKEAVGARTQTFIDLASAIGAELKLTGETERRLSHVPQVKQSIADLRKPQGKSKQIPKLDPATFNTISEIIDSQSVSLERTPKTVAKLEEDDIRNLILSTLNGTLNLGALGEAFSNRGKTDIYMVVPEGGIFIAECKIWHGPHIINEAIDQILGYLTWRDAYGVVLIFSRNKGFSGVLEAIPTAIKELASRRGEIMSADEHHWIARHALPSDEQQTVEIHYLAFNIYAKA